MSVLDLKLHGLGGVDDLKMVVANCRALGGVKILKAVYRKEGSELLVELNSNVSKDQILGIIKLAGDIRAEEQGIAKEQPGFAKDKSEGAPEIPSVAPLKNYFSDKNISKRYFVNGLLFGFSIISFVLNVILTYIVFRAK